jgi:pimeloyl-ACP methyl ester carboxylesterase
MQKRMHQLIPNSKRYFIKKAGHVAKIEKNEEFNRVVLNFLLELQRELLGNDLHDLNRAL